LVQESTFQVLNPWAEADPIPLKGLSQRLDSLSGKKIGLFANFKTAAGPILSVVEARVRERFPTAQFSHFEFMRDKGIADDEAKPSFDIWIKGVDTVIAAVGD
jgi:hypothetical protein